MQSSSHIQNQKGSLRNNANLKKHQHAVGLHGYRSIGFHNRITLYCYTEMVSIAKHVNIQFSEAYLKLKNVFVQHVNVEISRHCLEIVDFFLN